ncbi:MAG: hypothetical protein GWN58_24395, partial [Anaerolineae bacterium]|nr:hypothetical protein [Anaerolineae bacterium]
FVVLLVLSDLALFELLLELAHKAGGIEFLTLQQALAEGGFPPVIFFLLLLALGSKLGLIGFHIWLAPSFVHAAVAVRPMLVYYILGAGLLGWLRLLPLGEIYWPGAGSLLQWLAMTGAIYALAVGLLQTHLRSLLAYGVMALAALLLWVLGAVLEEPGLWSSVAADVHNMAAQAGFALALLFLHPLHLDTTTATWLRRGGTTLNWLGVLVLASSPLGLIVAL